MQEEHNSKFIKISFLSLYFYTVPTFTHEGKEDKHFLSYHFPIIPTFSILSLVHSPNQKDPKSIHIETKCTNSNSVNVN